MIEDLFLRDMFNPHQTSRLNQGSVFNFAYHEDYINDEVLGVVITARCDIANSKTDKYSFLPAIPLSKWLDKEIPFFLKRKILKNKEAALNNSLMSYGLTINSVKIYGADRVLEIVKQKVKANKYESIENKIKEYIDLNSATKFAEVYSAFEKDIKGIIKDIVENKVMDFFFIDSVGEYGPCIVNLREVNHLDRIVAKKISSGIEISSLGSDAAGMYRSLNLLDDNGLVSIIGEVRSPYIELLMQRFSENYTRIGVDNHHDEMVDTIFSNIEGC